MQQERWKQFVPKQLFPFGQWLISVFTSSRGGGIEEELVAGSSISMEPPKSVQQKEQIAPSRAIYSAEKATKSTALNGTVKKCRFNQFLSNVCTLHSQSCEVEKNILLQPSFVASNYDPTQPSNNSFLTSWPIGGFPSPPIGDRLCRYSMPAAAGC